MKKTMLIIALVGLFMGSFAINAWAKPMNGPGSAHFWGAYARLKNELGLSLDQQQKIMSIQQDFEKDTLNLRYEMYNKRRELRQLWKVDTLDQKAIDAKTIELNGLRIQMISKRRPFLDKLKAVLTPAQRGLIYDYMQKHSNKIKDSEEHFSGNPE